MFWVDAFTSLAFAGNPACVCLVESASIADQRMQSIATEMNVSETAFVARTPAGYSIRWFTPRQEVPLCGHATLATAHILWEQSLVPDDTPVVFQSKSGELRARNVNHRVELDFPQLFVQPADESEVVNRGFGFKPIYTARNDRRYLLEIEDAGQLRRLTPDFSTLREADRGAFMITCKSDTPEYDFLCRFFAPGVGIDADPVTGSAHCYLAPYWSRKLRKPMTRSYQATKRGGELECEVTGNDRVLLRGSAVTIASGNLRV